MRASPLKWQFPGRIRPNAFTWNSSTAAVQSVRNAVKEITAVAQDDWVTAAEGAVRLIERLSPAFEPVDSSSGTLGSAVNRAIETLVPIIAAAPVNGDTRERWLERLYAAHEADGIPYIEILTDFWGTLCAGPELANAWADRLIGMTRMALSMDRNLRGHFHATTACLDALLHAGRFAELHALLEAEILWRYKRWAVKALAAEGRIDEAIALADPSRCSWTSDTDLNRLCEGMLLSQGRTEEAYRRYGLHAYQGGTYLATFRALSKAYPGIAREQILRDLVESSPGEEGNWFATAKNLGLYELALGLAGSSPCDPKTLARAARDFVEREPRFAQESGFIALYWLSRGYGYEISTLDIQSPYTACLKAAEYLDNLDEIRQRIRTLLLQETEEGFLRQILGGEFGLK